jgi:hypothetical protein
MKQIYIYININILFILRFRWAGGEVGGEVCCSRYCMAGHVETRGRQITGHPTHRQTPNHDHRRNGRQDCGELI